MLNSSHELSGSEIVCLLMLDMVGSISNNGKAQFSSLLKYGLVGAKPDTTHWVIPLTRVPSIT